MTISIAPTQLPSAATAEKKLYVVKKTERPLKIAYIGSRGFPGFNAGVEKMLEQVCPRLSAMGHDVTLYCSKDVTTSLGRYEGTNLHRMPAVPTKHLETLSRTFLSIIDAFRRDYDVVHFHSIGPSLLSWIMRLKPGVRVAVTVHGLDWQRAKWGNIARNVLRIGEWSAAAFPHRTVVVSKPLADYYRERYGHKVDYIPNGVNESEHARPAHIARQWSLKPKDYVLFMSRLVPEKECHTLIEAYFKVHTSKKLVIAGDGWHSEQYVNRIKQAARRDPRIIFTGWAEGEVARELYSNCFLFCLPSHIEGLSLALLEAMGYGACPLVSDIPENASVVSNYGFTFRCKNADDLAEKIQERIDNAEETEQMGKMAREYVHAEYSWDKVAEEMDQFYQRLTAKLEKEGRN